MMYRFIDAYGDGIPLNDVIWACDEGDPYYGKDSAIYACLDLGDCDETVACLELLFS